MTLNQYLTYNPDLKLATAISSSGGVSDASKVIATGADGKLGASLFPLFYLGTTQIDYGRASAPLALTGITSIDGSAAKWTTGRTISLTGDVTGTSGSFDGSANLSFATTLANSGVSAGTYRSVTVDAKGRVTAGTNPTTLSGYGITDAINTSAATQSKSGNLYITSTTASTSSSTGAFVVGGGMGVVGSIYTTNLEIEGGNTSTPSISFTSNDMRWISFRSFLRAAPSFTTRSVGTKLALYTNLTESSTDYAIGVELNAMWLSVSQNSNSFKWYGGTTLAATLTGTGDLTLNGTTASTSKTTGALVVTGGVGVGGDLWTTNLASTTLAGTGNRAVYSTSTGVLTNSSSDISLKTNINYLSYGLSEVLQLKPVSYQWKDKNKLGSQIEIGLIAQDVKEIIPEVVERNNDGTLSLDYPKLVAVLINAIKELKEELNANRNS